MGDVTDIRRRCGEITASGKPCMKWPLEGFLVCELHGGPGRKAGIVQVKSDLARFGLQAEEVSDPGEVMTWLVEQSKQRVDLYSELLQRAYDIEDMLGPDTRYKMDGGIRALIGDKVQISERTGELLVVGEAIRGLAALEKEERDRCMAYTKAAVQAGLAERQTRVAEVHAALLVGVVTAALDAAQVTGQARVDAQNAAAAELEKIAG